MAGMGPAPKPASQRRRRNKSSTAVVLTTPSQPVVLPINLADYLPPVREWLLDIAKSPMAEEWDRSDLGGILLIADLMQAYWLLPPEKAVAKATLAAEIRLQRVEFGLTPLARRRLQWEIDRAEEAVAKTTARRSAAPKKRADPRLRAV